MGKQVLNKYAIIVAGGAGTRMKSEVPKQFMLLRNRPILLHTVERFLEIENCEVILVLPKAEQAYWQKEVTEKYADSIVHHNERIQVADGGITRFQSVKNGLAEIKEESGVIAVHDGVRPLVSKEIIEQSFAEAELHEAVVVSISLKDSIREVNAGGSNKAVNRSNYRLMQTPQTFNLQLLKLAYEQQESPLFTDDASVVEALGNSITLIEGDYQNIKITTPEDMIIAEAFLKS
jgi:2-C-methyl-D-erythritol 4-phosphate cytidylyltransferase